MSELEARKLKYPTTGTEALLMGVLIEGNYLICYIENFLYLCVSFSIFVELILEGFILEELRLRKIVCVLGSDILT